MENKNEIEVVVFEADSLEDLKQTHSRYLFRVKEIQIKQIQLLLLIWLLWRYPF